MQDFKKMTKAELVAFITENEAALKLAKDELNVKAIEDLNGKKSGSETFTLPDGTEVKMSVKVTPPSVKKDLDNTKFFSMLEDSEDLGCIYEAAKANGDVKLGKPTVYLKQIEELVGEDVAKELTVEKAVPGKTEVKLEKVLTEDADENADA